MADSYTTLIRRMAPWDSGIDITKSDSTIYSPALSAIHVGTGGTIRVLTEGGDTLNFTVATGTYIYGQFTKVLSTGTGASNMVGQWNER